MSQPNFLLIAFCEHVLVYEIFSNWYFEEIYQMKNEISCKIDFLR